MYRDVWYFNNYCNCCLTILPSVQKEKEVKESYIHSNVLLHRQITYKFSY